MLYANIRSKQKPSYGQVFTTCMFISVDSQLLLTCLQHRVVPSVLNPTQRVMSMIVNHLHQVFIKNVYKEKFCPLIEKKSTMHISYYTAVHHLHQVLRAKDGNRSSLFIEMKMIHQIISKIHWMISDESSTYHSICDHQLFRVVTWKHFSQFTCVLWQKDLIWVHLYSATYQTDMV